MTVEKNTLNEEPSDEFSRILYHRLRDDSEAENNERLPLDESKALHLEYPEAEMAGEPPEGIEAEKKRNMLRMKRAGLRVNYFEQRMIESGLSRKEIGNKAREIRIAQGHQGLNRSAFFRDFDSFFKSNVFMVFHNCWDWQMDALICQIFNIQEEEIPTLSESELTTLPLMEERVNLPRDLFVRNYRLLTKYREGICNTPELANIPFTDSSFWALKCWIQDGPPVSLGKILSVDASGVLCRGCCDHCGSHETRVYSTSGSILSGIGRSNLICLDCFKTSEWNSVERRVQWASKRYDSIAPFTYTRTRWTMSALVKALKALEESKGGK